MADLGSTVGILANCRKTRTAFFEKIRVRALSFLGGLRINYIKMVWLLIPAWRFALPDVRGDLNCRLKRATEGSS